MKKIKKGFTLVELLVVIAILAILATVSVVGYLSFTQKAKESKAQTELVQLRDVLTGILLTSTNEDEVYFYEDGTGDKAIAVKDTEDISAESDAVEKIASVSLDSSDLELFNSNNVKLFDNKNSKIDFASQETAVFYVYKVQYTIDGASAVWDIGDATVVNATIE